MFFLTFSNIWSFSYFFTITYFIFIISLILYLLPIISVNPKLSLSKNKTVFTLINSNDVFSLIVMPFALIIFASFLWSSPSLTSWFGHIIFTNFQVKALLLLVLSSVLILWVFVQSTIYSSKEIYDFLITVFNLFYWLFILFCTNSIFSTIFVIEVLSTLILLLIVTSTFSSAYFYKNTKLKPGNLFHQITPYTYIQSILYLFWVSLISSLNLFLFCLFFYIKILTFDFYLIEHIFSFFIVNSSLKEIIINALSWYILIFCLFLKCGIAPLYIWKPSFFKGIPFYTLFIYICLFYFFIFIFIIHLLTSYFSEIYYFYSLIIILFIVLGLMTLLFIVCEAFYIKTFLAISSLLNSIFVLLAIASPHINSILLVL